MLVSYISKQQAKNILKLIWKYSYLKKVKNTFIKLAIIDLIVLTIIYLFDTDYTLLIIFAIIIIGVIRYFAMKHNFKNQALSIFKKSGQYIILFADNSKQTQQQYTKFVSEQNIDEFTNVYHKKDIPMPDSPNYKIDTDEIFKQLYSLLNLKTIIENCPIVIETSNYLLLLSEQTMPKTKKTLNFIINKTNENLELMSKNNFSLQDLKNKIPNYLVRN